MMLIDRRGLGKVSVVLAVVIVAVLLTSVVYVLQPKVVEIHLSGSTTLYPLATKWAEEYMEKYPNYRIDVAGGGSGKGISDVAQNLVEIGMSSRCLKSEELEKYPSLIPIPVAHDAVMVIVNSGNPVLSKLLEEGISREALIKIYVEGSLKNWEYVAGIDLDGDGYIDYNETHALNPETGLLEYMPDGYRFSASYEIHPVTRSEASGTAETFAEFLGVDQEDLKGVGASGNPGVLQAVKNNLLAIGYVGLAFAFKEGVHAIPIDANNNGVIEEHERVDSEAHVASHIADYPISRTLFFVVNGEPPKEVADFIHWCLTEGQKYVSEVGYVPLTPSEVEDALALIS
ncbi:MAG: hypothetical protein DRJ68_03380 [Thermoprotei archaeon]|nr:MAG: hypothetical protein DRJ68_03380 [Thermoprotei archaeon]